MALHLNRVFQLPVALNGEFAYKVQSPLLPPDTRHGFDYNLLITFILGFVHSAANIQHDEVEPKEDRR